MTVIVMLAVLPGDTIILYNDIQVMAFKFKLACD